jgi:hypothetical protein
MYRYYMSSYLLLFRCTNNTIESYYDPDWVTNMMVTEKDLIDDDSIRLTESEAFLEIM